MNDEQQQVTPCPFCGSPVSTGIGNIDGRTAYRLLCDNRRCRYSSGYRFSDTGCIETHNAFARAVRQRDVQYTAEQVDALVRTLTEGAQLNTPDFLEWVADRLVHVHGDSPNVDFVQTLRWRAEKMRTALKPFIQEQNDGT